MILKTKHLGKGGILNPPPQIHIKMTQNIDIQVDEMIDRNIYIERKEKNLPYLSLSLSAKEFIFCKGWIEGIFFFGKTTFFNLNKTSKEEPYQICFQ